MSGTRVAALDRERMLNHVVDALLVLSNVGQGIFDLRVEVPDGVAPAVRAMFEGVNDMIGSLARETERAEATRRELEHRIETIEKQRAAIAELSTPVMEVWDGVLCFPVVGVMDTARSAEMTRVLLESVTVRSATCCIIDLTGIDVMDTATADHFLRMARAVGLLGAECVLTGIQPSMAQTIVHMGMDLSSIAMHATLRDALEERVGRRRTPK